MRSYLRCDPSQPSQVSSTAGMHACRPSDVIVLEYGEGKLSICNEHHLESIYLHKEEQARLKHFLISKKRISKTPGINDRFLKVSGARGTMDSSGPFVEADKISQSSYNYHWKETK